MTYDLHRLGWHSFQKLCLTICREILGQTVESFLDVSDGGRDGAFAGTWVRRDQEDIDGQFVIQCKFTNRKGYNLVLSDLSDEFEKAARLVKQKRCDAYVLITNAGLSGRSEEEIEAAFKLAGVKHILLFGSTWVCDQIRENKRLRMLVPRVYGLGDLSQILDERAYSQARALLESMSEDLSKIVITETYRQAASALDEHGFVLLIGEPAAGKTTIASLLVMSAIDQWQASPLKLDDPEKVVERWNPNEPSQFFWIDDAFGVTQYESHLVRGWNHSFLQIKAMIKRQAKIVMTSRDYIYNRARKELKESAFPLLRESQVVIDVHNLSLDEKQQILYNHLKMGAQPNSFRKSIKPYLEEMSRHERFVPETARRLADPIFTTGLSVDNYSLARFVNNQEAFLKETLSGLDEDSKAALALIYMRNDDLQSPIHLEQSEVSAIERLGSSVGGCVTALESLEGSLVQLTAASGNALWRFKHPTIGDAYARILSDSPELIGVFVQGSNSEKLLGQVTCGDVGYEHAVILGVNLFSLMLKRLDDFTTSSSYKTKWMKTWYAERRTFDFLARRCSKKFLEIYIDAHPNLLEKVARPGLFLYAVSELDVAIRLHEFGLLPEVQRLVLVDTVTKYAIEGEDLYALSNPGLKGVFTDTEYATLRKRVRTEMVPRINDIRREWQSGRGGQDSAQDQMQPLLESLETLRVEYDDPEVREIVDIETQHINDWIAEQEGYEEPDPTRRSISDINTSDGFDSRRSIFDDVDA